MKAADAQRALRKLRNPVAAQFLSGFFKTGKGQYAEGDRFLGIKVPVTRQVAKGFVTLPLPELQLLLKSPWHEERLLALVVLGAQFARGDEKTRKQAFAFYLRNTRSVNNWDLVDVSAPSIVGAYLLDKDRAILRKLARSKSLWERRIAIVSTQYLIRKGHYTDTLELAERLLTDQHDLMHKAIGWMLREVGKKDRATLTGFLDQHAAVMPRTMLRYSIEHFSPAQRAYYMKQRKH